MTTMPAINASDVWTNCDDDDHDKHHDRALDATVRTMNPSASTAMTMPPPPPTTTTSAPSKRGRPGRRLRRPQAFATLEDPPFLDECRPADDIVHLASQEKSRMRPPMTDATRAATLEGHRFLDECRPLDDIVHMADTECKRQLR